MKIRKLNILFIVVFFAMILVPLFNSDFYGGQLSIPEKRFLAQQTKLINDDNNINVFFPAEFEAWINDNIGFRENIVAFNAKVQYYIFNVLSNNSDMVLGPNGEFNFIADDIIPSYQHFDLKTDEELTTIVNGFQSAKNYLDEKGIQLFYFQCWDKQSIYPEYFPDTVVQHGDISRADQIVEALENRTDICVISPKKKLIDAKDTYQTYSRWGDPAHWTDRGAFIGYKELMNAINLKNDNKYRVLDENDYDITITDQGYDLFGGIHKEDYLESFSIKNPSAYLTDEEPKWMSSWTNCSRHIYCNDSVSNDDTLLIIGDSYFDCYLYDDLAESFHKVIIVWGDFAAEFIDIVDYYNPDILIIENPERCDRTTILAEGVLEYDELTGN